MKFGVSIACHVLKTEELCDELGENCDVLKHKEGMIAPRTPTPENSAGLPGTAFSRSRRPFAGDAEVCPPNFQTFTCRVPAVMRRLPIHATVFALLHLLLACNLAAPVFGLTE